MSLEPRVDDFVAESATIVSDGNIGLSVPGSINLRPVKIVKFKLSKDAIRFTALIFGGELYLLPVSGRLEKRSLVPEIVTTQSM
jgi:hypothetical protein